MFLNLFWKLLHLDRLDNIALRNVINFYFTCWYQYCCVCSDGKISTQHKTSTSAWGKMSIHAGVLLHGFVKVISYPNLTIIVTLNTLSWYIAMAWRCRWYFKSYLLWILIEWTKSLANVSPASCQECLEIWQEGSWGKMPVGTDWKVATKILCAEDNDEMFTANLQSFSLNMIYIGWQIMQNCNYWISTTQWTFQKGDISIWTDEIILDTQTARSCVVKLSKQQYHPIWVRL